MRLIFLYCLFFFGAAFAAGKDDFIWGKKVEVSQDVEGDLYVIGGQVLIEGHVSGDVLVAGGSVVIAGRVDGNVRALAGQILISGRIGKSVTVLGGFVQSLSSASIGGNFVTCAGSLEFSSSINRNLTAVVGQMQVTSRASIGNDIDYTSASEAHIEPGASIGGAVKYHISEVRQYLKDHSVHNLILGSKLVAILMNFIYSFAIGWIMLRVFPDTVQKALFTLQHHFQRACGFGALVLILLPLAGLLLFITVIGIPFALTLIALNVLTFYTAKVITVLWASQYCFKKIKSPLAAFALGLVIYFLITMIPILGIIFAFAATVLGLGATLGSKKLPKAN